MRTISLTLDDEVLARAEALARESGATLNQLFTQALSRFVRERTTAGAPLSPDELASLRGIIHLSPEDEARGYRAIVADEQAKKYSQ